MKFLIALLAVSAATAEWTCDDCTAVVGTIGSYLSSEESVGKQVEVLVAVVCPEADNPEECVELLPAFWAKIAMLVWPGYFNPEETFMCAREGLCGAPGARMIDCAECKEGMNMAISQLLSEEFIGGIVDALSGEGFCGMEENPEMCAKVIQDLIPVALPTLAGSLDDERQEMICNLAIPDTCPA